MGKSNEEARRQEIREELNFYIKSEELPPLSGSERQITWANDIRASFLNYLVGWLGWIQREYEPEDAQWLRQTALGEISTHKDAKWWIDNRGNVSVMWWTDQWKEQVIRDAAKNKVRKPFAMENVRLIVFDVDGTLVTPKSGATFRKSADDWEWITGRLEKCQELVKQGVKVAIASNQGGVAFGFLSKEAITKEIVKVMADITGIAYYPSPINICYTHPKAAIEEYKRENDPRRKPGGGMILESMETFNVSPEHTLMVGDRPEDEEAAKVAGVQFIHADVFFKAEQ